MKLWKRTIKLILCTIISLLYINSLAFAEETTNNNGENTTFIEGKGEYASIQKAIDAIDKEGTIYVLKNHTISKQIVIPTNKNITIKPIGKIEIVRSADIGKIPLFRVEKGSNLILGEEKNNITNAQLMLSTEWDEGYNNSYITKLVETEGTLILNSDVLLRLIHDSYQTGIKVKKNGSLIMNGNAKIETGSTSVVGVKILENGSFEMNDTSVLNGVVSMGGDSHFTMNNGSILGLYDDYLPDPLIRVKDKSLFTMNGGSISGNKKDPDYGLYGPVGVYDEAIFVMNGGSITGNSAKFGGAVSLLGDGIISPSFIMNGGSITKNQAYMQGGAVCMIGKSIFKMNGGSIVQNYILDEDNEANLVRKIRREYSYRSYGGAIFMGRQCIFVMTGGEISNNSANTENGLAEGGDGGAISARGAKISLLGGTIGNNSADIGNILLEKDTEMEVSTQMQVTGDIYIDKESSIKITKDEEESVQFQLPEGYEKELGGLQLNLQSENKEDWISFIP